MKASIPLDEVERLQALHQYDVLDTAPEQEFDDLTQLAAQICGTPISAITLVDHERQWFKSRVGLTVAETPRDVSFCAHAILGNDLLLVPDVRDDERFADNPFVLSELHLRFYAGVPLVTPEGQAVGTLCVIDTVPRQLDQSQQDALRRLGRQAVALLEARPEAKARHEAENSLKASEVRYRRLFEAAKDGILILDAESGKIENVNPYLCQLLGYAPDDFIGKQLWEIGTFRDIAANQDAFRTLQEKEYIRHDDLPLETKDRRSVSVEFVSNVYICAEKKVIQCNIRDISERKRAEKGFRESQTQLHEVMTHTRCILWSGEVEGLPGWQEHSRDENFFQWNLVIHSEQAAQAVLPLDLASGQSYRQAWGESRFQQPGNRVQADATSLSALMNGAENYAQEFACHDREGRLHWLHEEVSIEPAEHGLWKVFGVVTDITERVDAKEIVQESQRFLQSTLDALSSHIAVLDQSGEIIAVNKSWRQFSEENDGTAISCGVGANYLEVCGSASGAWSGEAPTVTQGIREIMAGGRQAFCLEYPCHSPSEERWFNVRVTRFAGEGPLRVVVTHENITERKLAENLTRTSEANLAVAQQIAHMGSWELDLSNLEDVNKNPLRWSDEVFRIFGYQPGQIEVSNENFFRAVHPDDRVALAAVMAEAAHGGKPYSFEHRIILPDGKERIVHEQSDIVFDEFGKPLKMAGIVQDITERQQVEEALWQSEKEFRAVFDNALDAIIITDNEGRFLQVNAAACQLYGVSREQILRMKLSDFVEAGWDYEQANLSFRTASHQKGEFQITLPDGTKKFVEFAATSDFLPGRHLTALRDVTERKQAEEAQQRQQAELRALFDLMPAMIWFKDTENGILRVNKRVAEAAGKSVEEIEGKSSVEIYPQEAAKFYADDLKVIRSGVSKLDYVETLRDRDGKERWVQTDKVPFCDAEGKVIGIVVMAQDITERKQVEAALRESEIRYRALAEAAPDGVFIFNRDGILQYMNQHSAQRFGALPEALVGKSQMELFPPQIAETNRQSIDRVFQSGEAFYEERHLTFPDRDVWQGTWLVPLKNTAGEVSEVMGVARDISGQKQTEAALQKANDELEARVVERTAELGTVNESLRVENIEHQMTMATLRQVAEALQQAKHEADTANLAKSEFLSRMSHELRTPLNAILGFGQILDKEDLDPLAHESVGYILKGGRHLLDLINEVLDIARVEAGHVDLSLEPIALDDIVPEACALVRPLASERHIHIIFEQNNAERGRKYIMADLQRFKQVLINLLSNAIKYNREGGQVEVSCEQKPDGWTAIAIRDTGPGISPDNLLKLFTPFERLGASTTNIEGTGLGLVLSQRLVTAMGGTLNVESTLGQGTTFTIELPQATPPQEQLPTSPEVHLATRKDVEHSYSVLCIEDNLSNLRLMEVILKRRPGITLLAAMQGSVGLDLARQHEPDLILLDLNLPDINGSEVLARLQQSALTKDIPVVIISADATPHQIERLLAAGAKDYLTKPLDVNQFLQTLDKFLQATPATETEL